MNLSEIRTFVDASARRRRVRADLHRQRPRDVRAPDRTEAALLAGRGLKAGRGRRVARAQREPQRKRKAKEAIIAYEQAVHQFAQDTQHLDYPDGEVYLMFFAKKALEVAGPKIGSVSLDDLVFTKDLIRANELLMSRPEVEAVDPGFGIRINVNTDTLVARGGDYTKWKEDVTKLLRDQLITGELNFSKNNNSDGALEAAQKLLQRAVGKANVRDGYSMGDKDFPDHVRGTEVTLYVKKDALAEARRHTAELRALFAPHGVDMKHFELNIEEDR